MMIRRHICVVLILLLAIGFSGLNCADLDKYQKPEGERQSPPVPETRAVEIKLNPQELAETQEFATALQTEREQFASQSDTATFLKLLDSLATVAVERWRSLPDTVGSRQFYILANADILNQLFILRRAQGDEMGARRAQRLLLELKPHLPPGNQQQ